jgi:ABC-type transport system involved in cytochrome bd biosynthesis fused ATPase/permease subunit
MTARAEGAPRIDHDRLGVPGDLPRRADPETPDLCAVVELAPAVLPPLRDVGRLDHVEANGRFLGVDGERTVELLDSLREDVEEERKLRLAADDDVPLQRNALFSFSKKPSSAL